MPAERFDFRNASGQSLAALLDRPAGEPRAYALFAHCFTCGKDVHAARRIAEALTALDIAVLRFDFTGLGSSEGEFANTTFSSNVGDLVAAAAALRRAWQAPAILIGHSLGGTAVLAAAADVPEADRKSTRLNSSHLGISYAVFCLKKKKKKNKTTTLSMRHYTKQAKLT